MAFEYIKAVAAEVGATVIDQPPGETLSGRRTLLLIRADGARMLVKGYSGKLPDSIETDPADAAKFLWCKPHLTTAEE